VWAARFLIYRRYLADLLHLPQNLSMGPYAVDIAPQIPDNDTDGDYLLTQRDHRKPNYGGYFEATAGGSALKGEDADSCARRELREETGIDAGTLTNIGHFVSHNTIYGIFLCVTDCDKNAVKLQEGETVSYKWISEAEFISFVNSDAMIDVQYQRYLPYLKQMGYVK
jgi:8-oxo-dGTP pyrophosphatase MutT (NUDIX family)